ncbi:hypothetical protein B0H19DRAFT_1079576 [Mycena capillaripes]|nr:hypothetical protein B0H19DRAFT_1079576 [Mycena capillaripes]
MLPPQAADGGTKNYTRALGCAVPLSGDSGPPIPTNAVFGVPMRRSSVGGIYRCHDSKFKPSGAHIWSCQALLHRSWSGRVHLAVTAFDGLERTFCVLRVQGNADQRCGKSFNVSTEASPSESELGYRGSSRPIPINATLWFESDLSAASIA